VTKATGVDKVVKAVAGDDCGCKERQEALNKLFPYAQPMTADSVRIFEEVLRPAHNRNRMSAKDQHALMIVYAQIFGTKRDFSTCGGCVLQAYKKIAKAYEEYCEQ